MNYLFRFIFWATLLGVTAVLTGTAEAWPIYFTLAILFGFISFDSKKKVDQDVLEDLLEAVVESLFDD